MTSSDVPAPNDPAVNDCAVNDRAVRGPESKHPVRWGVVGTGDISQSFVPDMLRAANATFAAVCSRDLERARSFAATHGGAAAYGSLTGLLADPSVDAVYIGTPHGTHFALAAAALGAGKHVLVEKPMALNSEEVIRLINIARDSGRFLMEAMWTKFNPAIRDMQHLIGSGRIGDVRSVRASFGVPFPREVGSRWSAELGGSALLDQGIYPITLAQMVLGQPTRISASAKMFMPGVDMTEWMTFEYPDGRFAQLSSSMVEWMDLSATINGSQGYLRLDAPFWTARSLTIHGGHTLQELQSPEVRNYTVDGNGFVPMIEAVSTAISNGQLEHPWHSWSDTLTAFTTLDAVRQAFDPTTCTPSRSPSPKSYQELNA